MNAHAEIPTYQVMPDLSDEEFAALKSDIGQRGVLVPVEYDEGGNILDGHHRVKACMDMGIVDWPRLIREGMSEDEKRTHARRLNLARRHLNQSQKRELVADDLKSDPTRSNRQIASGLGVDHKTVGGVRDGLEESGEIPHFSERRDPRTGNLSQPARKPIAAGVLGGEERVQLAMGYSSVDDLEAAIYDYLLRHNAKPKPFTWTKTAENILARERRALNTVDEIRGNR